MWWVFLILSVVTAYPIEHFDLHTTPDLIRATDSCIVAQHVNGTLVRFHDGREHFLNQTAPTMAVNQACDLILFGRPEHNEVVLWYPETNNVTHITPADAGIDVTVHRFGFSLDIQGDTWVVGAPGQPADRQGRGYSIGYAFVFVGTQLQSCRSLYDSYCWSVDHECHSGYKQWKDFNNLDDSSAADFQKKCTPFSTPFYVDGPLEENLGYFDFQQFGYAVALTGDIHNRKTSLYISAPGDTQRFMENNDGRNYGRVYIWDIRVLDHLAWWQMGVTSPLQMPNKREATYAAFGRDISASDSHLAVSSYPFYNLPDDAFVFMYDCRGECVETPNRGVSIEDLPYSLVLDYMTPDMVTYMTPFANDAYVPAYSDTLGDFQNDFIGKQVAVVGSNLLVADPQNKYVYRMGIDSLRRERHTFEGQLGASTNSEHWAHSSRPNRLTHLWGCRPGHVGRRDQCTPCSVAYYSPDGWLDVCDPCPVNTTTTQDGQSECQLYRPVLSTGLTWEGFVSVTVVLSTFAITCGGLLAVWQFACVPVTRRPRF
tara:strand:- start:1244 stop:2866 length:1623 start_codon:yes stop_codon:yes gene_type:complete